MIIKTRYIIIGLVILSIAVIGFTIHNCLDRKEIVETDTFSGIAKANASFGGTGFYLTLLTDDGKFYLIDSNRKGKKLHQQLSKRPKQQAHVKIEGRVYIERMQFRDDVDVQKTWKEDKRIILPDSFLIEEK